MVGEAVFLISIHQSFSRVRLAPDTLALSSFLFINVTHFSIKDLFTLSIQVSVIQIAVLRGDLFGEYHNSVPQAHTETVLCKNGKV